MSFIPVKQIKTKGGREMRAKRGDEVMCAMSQSLVRGNEKNKDVKSRMKKKKAKT